MRRLYRSLAIGVLSSCFAALPALAQDNAKPTWVIDDLVPLARAEGSLTVYSATNEQEALPLWKMFQDVTGVKINYIRGAEGALLSRITTETRAGQPSWDILQSSAVGHLPLHLLRTYDIPLASTLYPEARDPQKRWYGVYAAYNAPQYNTKLVAKSDLPTSYDDFLTKPQWAGRVVIDGGDREWLMGLLAFYGDERGRKLVQDLIRTLNPVVLDGHLAIARAVSAGEYPIALSNYTMLTSNMQVSGAPTDFVPLEPVSMFVSQVGISAQAPHPNAALLAANFLVSREAQQFTASTGRLPTRDDVEPAPRDALTRLRSRKIIPIQMTGETARAAQKLFDEFFKKR